MVPCEAKFQPTPTNAGSSSVMIGRSVAAEYRAESFGANVRHMERTHGAVALDQGKHGVHVPVAVADLSPRLATDKGQIRLDSLSSPQTGEANPSFGRFMISRMR
jgi:hypothetical protein